MQGIRFAGRIAFFLLAATGATADATWPQIALPKDAAHSPVGDRLALNGIPMRLTAFVTATPRERTAAWFRRSLGHPLGEASFGSMLVLGRPVGRYYLTVQLEAAGSGTRGIATVADMQDAADGRNDAREMQARSLRHLPAGSRIVSQMVSEDRGRASLHTVATNGHDEAVNRERLIRTLGEEGFVFERESRATDAPLPPHALNADGASTLFFTGAGSEATATIARDGQGQTVVVLNTVARAGERR